MKTNSAKAGGKVPDALVVDFLPAGFEIENPNFEHSIYADETVVRAVSPGTFTVPPPFAESMYKPEIRAFGDSGKVMKVEK